MFLFLQIASETPLDVVSLYEKLILILVCTTVPPSGELHSLIIIHRLRIVSKGAYIFPHALCASSAYGDIWDRYPE